MDVWPPRWFSRAVLGFGVYAVAGVAIGLASDRAPFGPVGAVAGAAGITGLFWVAMLWFLRAWMGVEIDDEGRGRPIGKASRLLALIAGAVFVAVCIGSILYLAGLGG